MVQATRAVNHAWSLLASVTVSIFVGENFQQRQLGIKLSLPFVAKDGMCLIEQLRVFDRFWIGISVLP
jgi:hypothetical protein